MELVSLYNLTRDHYRLASLYNLLKLKFNKPNLLCCLLKSRVCIYLNRLINCSPLDDTNQARAQKLAITVNQKTNLNAFFWDLCLSVCCAIAAPGQPPASANKCSVLSGVRQAPRLALDLSYAYRINVRALPAK